jgi:serine carboxypeptidase-like clade 1
MIMALRLFIVLVLTVTACFAAPEEDRIDSLPLFGPPPTPHYSGYLDATDGCNTEVNGAYCKIHYWFATAEDGPDGAAAADKPVVLWLNGGPGSSSILGLLQENGPLLMNATGGLMVNPYSWTTAAHLLVLESPVGVGYSYCEAQMDGDEVCQNTDKFTASASRAALTDFFHRKFPEYASNDFFATGESYAGVYLPTLAYEILQHNARHPTEVIPLRGLAVGDPCTDNTAQRDSMDALWYGHKYGLVDDAVFDQLWNECDVRLPNYLMRNDNSRSKRKQTKTPMERLTSNLKNSKDTPACNLALRKFLLSTSRALSQGWRDMFIDDYSLFAPVTDVEDQAMQDYMNRPDVRVALHVQESPVSKWPYPEAGFDYTKEYDACNDDVPKEGALSMVDFYRKIVPKLPSGVWVYNGDTDPCVSYEGTRTAVKRIGFSELDGGGYRPWFYNHTAAPLSVIQEKAVMFGPDLLLQNTGAQFGGEVVNYEHGLAFVTVHGSGHMVPQFRPQAALHMLTMLLRGKELSPLLPLNATLTSMTDDDFSDAMDKWTDKAKVHPYVTYSNDATKKDVWGLAAEV